MAPPKKIDATGAPSTIEGSLDFLKIPAVWMCFAFFFLFAMSLSGARPNGTSG